MLPSARATLSWPWCIPCTRQLLHRLGCGCDWNMNVLGTPFELPLKIGASAGR